MRQCGTLILMGNVEVRSRWTCASASNRLRADLVQYQGTVPETAQSGVLF